MSKALLILNMPENCAECILANEDYDVCQATKKSISYDERGYGIECPLKQMPHNDFIDEAESYQTEEEYKAYVSGWNECLDEILGEKE